MIMDINIYILLILNAFSKSGNGLQIYGFFSIAKKILLFLFLYRILVVLIAMERFGSSGYLCSK